MIPKRANIETLVDSIEERSVAGQWRVAWMVIGLFLITAVLTDMVTTIRGAPTSITGMIISEFVAQPDVRDGGKIESYRHPILWMCLGSQFLGLLIGFLLFTYGDRGILRSYFLATARRMPLRVASGILAVALAVELVLGCRRADDISNVIDDLSWRHYDEVLRPWGWLIGGAVFGLVSATQVRAVLRRANSGASALVAVIAGALASLIVPTIVSDFLMRTKPYAMGDHELLNYRWWETVLLSFLVLPVAYAWARRSRLGAAGVFAIQKDPSGSAVAGRVPALVHILDFRFDAVPRLLGRFMTTDVNVVYRWFVLRVEPSPWGGEIARPVPPYQITELTDYEHLAFAFDHGQEMRTVAQEGPLTLTVDFHLSQPRDGERSQESGAQWSIGSVYDVEVVRDMAALFASRWDGQAVSPRGSTAVELVEEAVAQELRAIYAWTADPKSTLGRTILAVMRRHAPIGECLDFAIAGTRIALRALERPPAEVGLRTTQSSGLSDALAEQRVWTTLGGHVLNMAEQLQSQLLASRDSLIKRLPQIFEQLLSRALGTDNNRADNKTRSATIDAMLSVVRLNVLRSSELAFPKDLDPLIVQLGERVQAYELRIAEARASLPTDNDVMDRAVSSVQAALSNNQILVNNPEMKKVIGDAIRDLMDQALGRNKEQQEE